MRNTGHYLEKAVEDELKKNTETSRHWRRLHDGKAALTYMPAQPSDFFLCINEEPSHFECKSQKGKTFRLKKFSQLPDMKRWSDSGVRGYVLVHFWELGEELIVVDVDNLDPSKPSWVLDGVGKKAGSIKEALSIIGWK